MKSGGVVNLFWHKIKITENLQGDNKVWPGEAILESKDGRLLRILDPGIGNDMMLCLFNSTQAFSLCLSSLLGDLLLCCIMLGEDRAHV